jgi:hypothetical protein
MPACIKGTENDESIVRIYLIDSAGECPPEAEDDAAYPARMGVRITTTTINLTT